MFDIKEFRKWLSLQAKYNASRGNDAVAEAYRDVLDYLKKEAPTNPYTTYRKIFKDLVTEFGLDKTGPFADETTVVDETGFRFEGQNGSINVEFHPDTKEYHVECEDFDNPENNVVKSGTGWNNMIKDFFSLQLPGISSAEAKDYLLKESKEAKMAEEKEPTYKLVIDVMDSWKDQLGEQDISEYNDAKFANYWYVMSTRDMNDKDPSHDWMKAVTLYKNGKEIAHSERTTSDAEVYRGSRGDIISDLRDDGWWFEGEEGNWLYLSDEDDNEYEAELTPYSNRMFELRKENINPTGKKIQRSWGDDDESTMEEKLSPRKNQFDGSFPFKKNDFTLREEWYKNPKEEKFVESFRPEKSEYEEIRERNEARALQEKADREEEESLSRLTHLRKDYHDDMKKWMN